MDGIRKILKINPGEGKKVFSFAFFAAMLQAGLAIGISCADALFLIHVGAEKLPHIYVATPFLMIVYIPVFAYLMNRLGIDRLLFLTMSVLVAGGAMLYLCLSPGLVPGFDTPPTVFYYAAKLYTTLWYIALYTLLWNFIDCYFHILDAKRLFSFMSAGMAFGTMVGGSIVVWLIRFVTVEHLFLAWSAIVLAAFPVVFRLRAKWRKISEEEALTVKELPSFREQASRLFSILRESRYTNYMIFAFLTTLMITTLCEFQYMQIFEQGRTDADIASLFGKLYAGVNGLNILINLFVFNRLVALIGVRNVILIQPIIYAFTFSYFLLDYEFGAAVAGFFAYQGILTSVEYNNQNFLFNAIPSRDKAQVRTFIEGLCEPLATASAGLFLIIFSRRLSAQTLSLIGLAGTALALCATFGLRANYLTSMISSLKKTWLSFSRSKRNRLTMLNTEELASLKKEAGSTNPQHATSAIAIYWLNDPDTALDMFLQLMTHNCINPPAEAEDFFETILQNDSSSRRRKILQWLHNRRMQVSPRLLEICARYNMLSKQEIQTLSENPNIAEQTAAAIARWGSWEPSDSLRSMQKARDLIAGSENEKAAAIQIVESSGLAQYAHYLAEFLQHESLAVREQAMRSISRMADSSSERLVPAITECVCSGEGTLRKLGFDALERIADPACIRPLIEMSSEFSPAEKKRVEEIILKTGLRCVPLLISTLRDPGTPFTNKSVVCQTLGILSFPQFEAVADEIIDEAIENAYRYINAHWHVSQSAMSIPSIAFLAIVYQDLQSSIIDFVLQTLTIAGRLPEFEMLAVSLRSRNPKERANAIETIEQGCSRKTFKMLLPLLDSRPLNDTIAFYRRNYDHKPLTLSEILLESCTSRIAIEQSAALQAAWRLNLGDDDPISRSALLKIIKNEISQTSKTTTEVIFGLLSETGAEDNSHIDLNPIETAYCLTKADFFSDVLITQLVTVINTVHVKSSANGLVYNIGDEADTIFVVLNGEIELTDKENVSRPRGCLQIAGEDILRGSAKYREKAIARNATLLCIPAASIQKIARIHPETAIQMFVYANRMQDTKERK